MSVNPRLSITKEPQSDITDSLKSFGFEQTNTYRSRDGNVILEYADAQGNTRLVKYSTGSVEAYRHYDESTDPTQVDWDVLGYQNPSPVGPYEVSAFDAIQFAKEHGVEITFADQEERIVKVYGDQ